eukprot:TRINITY_DN37893_c0_g1_i1.p1 TRINITY_DN37893_c0_g1~~TRINITY_DN37893_c0_g1_i1.p1  ORF type:complete len:308 (-),score=36.00 TRINITY_DN37893_c0_g1_i1:74-958(-)
MACAAAVGINTLPPELEDGETICNSGDDLAVNLAVDDKLVWLVRHGQSTGNAAKEKARAADEGTGQRLHEDKYRNEVAYIDAPLTELGLQQAEEGRQLVAQWKLKPTLVVSSPLTRAIQTAAIMFQDVLRDGTASLLIRPEIREFWADNNENMGRPVEELRTCPILRALDQWTSVELALSATSTAEWKDMWDAKLACGNDGAWQCHVADGTRLNEFKLWLNRQCDTRIAIVSHWGTINNVMNREPWTQQRTRQEVPESWCRTSWPTGGAVKVFNVRNCGWLAVLMTTSSTRAPL